MVERLIAEPFTSRITEHGEGPLWLSREGHWLLVDLLQGDLIELGLDGSVLRRRQVGAVAAAVRPRTQGGLVAAVDRGFILVDEEGKLTKLADAWVDPTVRMNEGACDRAGRFYGGSMAYDASPGRGALYRLNLDGTIATVLRNVTISNGLVFEPSGLSALYIDSAAQQVRRYWLPTDEGEWDRFDVVVDIDPALGSPDGFCLDQDGGMWVALWGAGRVHRYDADGYLTAEVLVDATQVTSCALGGPDGRSMIITTSTLTVDATAQPGAGAVFATRVAVPGVPILEARV